MGGSFITESLIDLIRVHRQHQIAVTAVLMAATSDLPDARERIEAAAEAAAELRRKPKQPDRDFYRRVEDIAGMALFVLDSAQKHGVEWPLPATQREEGE